MRLVVVTMMAITAIKSDNYCKEGYDSDRKSDNVNDTNRNASSALTARRTHGPFRETPACGVNAVILIMRTTMTAMGVRTMIVIVILPMTKYRYRDNGNLYQK